MIMPIFDNLPGGITNAKLVSRENYNTTATFRMSEGFGERYINRPDLAVMTYYLCFDKASDWNFKTPNARIDFDTINNVGNVVYGAYKELSVHDTNEGSGYDNQLKEYGRYYIELTFSNDYLPNHIYLYCPNGTSAANLTESLDNWLAVQTFTPFYTVYAVESSQLIRDYGLLRVYKLNTETGNAVANYRYVRRTSSGSSSEYTYEDLGKYIVSLVRYPFEVDDFEDENIYLGWRDTGLTCKTVENQIHSFTLGTQKIEGLNGNSGDIDDCEITALLPFVGLRNIGNEYINTEISIRYFVDILSNNCVVKIYSNDLLIDEIPCQIGFDIPFSMKGSQGENDLRLEGGSINNSILKKYAPKITVRQRPQVNGARFETKSLRAVKDCMGFCRFEEVEVDGIECTFAEREMISRLLQEGIWIGSEL